MKGFASVIVMLAVFATTLLLLNTSIASLENISVKENFSETAFFISNYEIALIHAAQDYDWADQATVKQKITNDSASILTIITPQNTTCNTISTTNITISGEEANFTLECTTIIKSEETLFENRFQKQVTLKKYP